MQNKTFTLLVVAICAFIMATCCFGGFLYSESNRLTVQLNDSTDSVKPHHDDISKMLVADSVELQRIADERKKSLDNELKTSLEKENATRQKQTEKEQSYERDDYERAQSDSREVDNSNSHSRRPYIYSADSFMRAAADARIYNPSGGQLDIDYRGLWIGGTMVSGFAPRVISFNSTGGTLVYETPDSRTITLVVDFSENIVMVRVSGGSRNLKFTIR